MTSNPTKPTKTAYRIPKELDILPPRPVLFPWLPGGGIDFRPCLGLGESSKEPGTPATQPLSPSNSEDEFEDAMPDMSNVDDIPKQKRYNHRRQQQQQQQLDSLTDVIVEILRVIFFILKTKQALLKENGEGPREMPKISSQKSLKGTVEIV